MPIAGSAAGGNSTGAAPTLEKCEKPLGTIAISEPQSELAAALSQYKLPAPTQLLRLIIQQSNCFQVVERGAAFKNLIQERALAKDGEMQEGQNLGKGQLVAADFLMTANVSFTSNDSGGAGIGAIGGMFGIFGAVAGALAAGIKFKEAQTSLLVSDARSGLQVAAAQGSAEKTDWGIGGAIGGVGLGAYSNTPEGKIVAAALLDNYNNIVKSVRTSTSLVQRTSNSSSEQNAANSVTANAYKKGDILKPKIGGVEVLVKPEDSSDVVVKLSKEDDVLYLGIEKDGFYKIKSSKGDGWVESMMLKK